MHPVEEQRADKLLALARKRFDQQLRPIEEEVLRHSCQYEDPPDWVEPEQDSSVEILPGELTRDPTGRPVPGWEGPELRPALLRWLLTDAEATVLLEPRGLRVWNVRFTEPLDLTGCRVLVRLELRYCLVEAPIRLGSADLPTLSLRNSTLLRGLDAPFLKLHGPLLLEHITAGDTLRFDGAIIEGQVYFGNTTLTATGDALSMRGASVGNDLLLRPKLKSLGRLSMKGIRVGGFIELFGAKLTMTETALDFDGAAIRGNVFLTRKFESAGEVRMLGIEIGGDLECGGAKLTARGEALSLDRAKIRGAVFLRDGFESSGEVLMLSTEIGGDLDCREASIRAFIGQNMEVKGDLVWEKVAPSEQMILNLRGANIKGISDDWESWPEAGHLLLHNLIVEDLRPLRVQPLNTTGRIAWLNRQPESDLAEPQPWMQLAKLLEDKGHKRAAKRVIYELRKHQAKANWKDNRFGWFGKFGSLVFARLEEQPLHILWSIAILVAVFGGFFHRYEAHFAPTNEGAYKKVVKPDGTPGDVPLAYPKFQPFVYALENELPVVKLGQDDRWGPDVRHSSVRLYWSLMGMRWVLILAGYVQGGILAAAVSVRFRS